MRDNRLSAADRRRHRTRHGRRLGFLLLSLQDLLRNVAGLMRLRPVDLRLHIGFVPRRRAAAAPPSLNVGAHTLGFIRLDRARMGFLLGDPNCGESVENFLALNFQLSR
jgi:hypothetical protein